MSNPENIGPGGEILDQQRGLQTFQPGSAIEYNPAERAAEAEVRAMVEARCIMALRRPRNIHQCRAKVLDACVRPTFAEQALYRKPVGNKKNETTGQWEKTYAEGPSIRFAEEAFRALGNLWASVTVQLETPEKRVLRLDMMDLESNNTDSTIITVPKTVERKSVKEGQTVISQRMNSYNQLVYLVEATDDDLQVKQQAMVAKARRDAIMRMFPSDLKEDAIDAVKKTLEKRDKADPQGALKRLLDAFQMELRVLPDQIEKYLGHELTITTPAEIQSLRGAYTAIKEGEITWADTLKAVEEDRTGTIKANANKATARQDEKKKAQTPAEKAKEKAAGAGAQMAPAGDPPADTPPPTASSTNGTLNLD